MTILFKLGRNLEGILENGNFSSNDNSVNDKISILRNFSKSFIEKFDVKDSKWCKGVNGLTLWSRHTLGASSIAYYEDICFIKKVALNSINKQQAGAELGKAVMKCWVILVIYLGTELE